MEVSSDAVQSQKFSRYRSVRKAAARDDNGAPPIPEIPSTEQQVIRAPSRYRRPGVQRSHDAPLPTISPPQVTDAALYRSPVMAATARTQQSQNTVRQVAPVNARVSIDRKREARDPYSAQYDRDASKTGVRTSGQRMRGMSTPTTSDCPSSMRPSSEAAREEARLILEGEHERLANFRIQQQQKYQRDRVKRAATVPAVQSGSYSATTSGHDQDAPPPEKSRKWIIGLGNGPPKLKDEKSSTRVKETSGRPEFREGNGPPQMKRQVQKSSTPDNLGKGNGPPQMNRVVQPKPAREQKFVDAPQPHKVVPSHPSRSELPPPPSQAPKSTMLSPESRHLAPAPETFDAPVSAVNAGERRVKIQYDGANITLPVTPTTTAKDLLNSASVCLSQPVDPRTSILVEVFGQLGLERPLRRYERIRDVLNSWDSDSQNHLSILSSGDCDANGLELKDAPEKEPGTVMLHMHHSQRPGKWEKHWVILRSDGQVTASKRENDGNAPNIFHISDYDVYMPTRQQLKKLKPPKKVCFAVKSQQKSAMFLEGANYVHFFATSEKSVADMWYNAIQSWRSWWLVEMLGEGKSKKPPPADAVANIEHSKRPGTAQSRESILYQLGSFEPLLDFSIADIGTENFGRPSEDNKADKGSASQTKPLIDFASNRKSFDQTMPTSPRQSSRYRDAPPSSFPTRMTSEASDSQSHARAPSHSDQGFTGKGLLARSLSSKRTQGGEISGHGVSGAKGKPLVDWSPNSEFVNGSLLQKLAGSTYTEPIIDRSRNQEARVKVGEGV